MICSDGDDSGHGGYRGGYNLFEKITTTHGQMQCSGSLSEFPAAMNVIKVIV